MTSNFLGTALDDGKLYCDITTKNSRIKELHPYLQSVKKSGIDFFFLANFYRPIFLHIRTNNNISGKESRLATLLLLYPEVNCVFLVTGRIANDLRALPSHVTGRVQLIKVRLMAAYGALSN